MGAHSKKTVVKGVHRHLLIEFIGHSVFSLGKIWSNKMSNKGSPKSTRAITINKNYSSLSCFPTSSLVWTYATDTIIRTRILRYIVVSVLCLLFLIGTTEITILYWPIRLAITKLSWWCFTIQRIARYAIILCDPIYGRRVVERVFYRSSLLFPWNFHRCWPRVEFQTGLLFHSLLLAGQTISRSSSALLSNFQMRNHNSMKGRYLH